MSLIFNKKLSLDFVQLKTIENLSQKDEEEFDISDPIENLDGVGEILSTPRSTS